MGRTTMIQLSFLNMVDLPRCQIFCCHCSLSMLGRMQNLPIFHGEMTQKKSCCLLSCGMFLKSILGIRQWSLLRRCQKLAPKQRRVEYYTPLKKNLWFPQSRLIQTCQETLSQSVLKFLAMANLRYPVQKKNMWVKQCHKPPMTGKGNQISPIKMVTTGGKHGIVLSTLFNHDINQH